MTLVGFKAQNHRQQVGKRGPRPEVDNLATTPETFEPLHERFGFTIDVAALPNNRKCERYFAPPGPTIWACMWRPECPPNCPCPHEAMHPVAVDGLKQSWAGERVWCNPPYSSIEPWLEKAHGEWLLRSRPAYGGPELIVMLLPANRTEQGWWQRQVEPHLRQRRDDFHVEFLSGRLRFIKHGHDRVEPNQRPPFGCCLVIWGGDR